MAIFNGTSELKKKHKAKIKLYFMTAAPTR